MRYYEIHLPDSVEPVITTRLRGKKDLPQGTRIEAIITDRDGSLIDSYEIPVVDGKPAVSGRGKHRPKFIYG